MKNSRRLILKKISQSSHKFDSIEMTWLFGCYKKGRTNSTKIFKGFVRPFILFMMLVMSHFGGTEWRRNLFLSKEDFSVVSQGSPKNDLIL